jgi:hypothetical protein
MSFLMTHLVEAMRDAHPGRLDLNVRIVLRTSIDPAHIYVAMPSSLSDAMLLRLDMQRTEGEIWLVAHPRGWHDALNSFATLVSQDIRVLDQFKARGYGKHLEVDVAVCHIHHYFRLQEALGNGYA